MSLLSRHKLITGRLVPHVHNTVTAGIGSTNTYTITPLVAPVAGRLLVITAGGTQSRSVVTPPTGFTNVASLGAGSGTNVLYYRIATGSEPANWTIVWSGSLNGGWDFMEVSAVDTVSPFGFHFGNSASSVTTLAPAASGYNVTMPGVAFTYISKSSTASWTPDNSYFDLSGAGEHKVGYKVYSGPATGDTVNWAGTVETVTAEIIFIKGKLI